MPETTALACAGRRIYKHRFTITVLSETRLTDLISLADLHYAISSGPDIGLLEIDSCEEIVGREAIINECIMVGNKRWFVDRWEEEDG